MFGRNYLVLFLTVLFASVVFAANVQVDVNGQYYVGGAVTISGTVSPVGADDLNIVLADAITGTVTDQNVVTADANGNYTITFNSLTARDYNGTVTDIDSSATNRFYFTITIMQVLMLIMSAIVLL